MDEFIEISDEFINLDWSLEISDEFPMHQAAKEGDLDRVRQLIESGVSVDSLDDQGRTPLHWAAIEDRHAVAEVLVSSMCNLNLKDRRGRTPVLLAADCKNQSIVDLLLQRGAQVTCADPYKWTLLHRVSRNGWTDQVNFILDRGEADLNAATEDGVTPLQLAVENGHDDVAVLLVQAGADVNRRDADKMTALHWAAMCGRTRVVQVLLEKEGLHLNPQRDDGATPLHDACFMGCREVVMQLLVAGADTTLKNNRGETALSEGIGEEQLNHGDIRLFVQHGAFLQDCDYESISRNPFLKENVLKDVDLCTQSIVNKFHRQSLPALSRISYFARKRPNMYKFKLNARQVEEVENLVKSEIQRNTYCNVVKAHPMALSALCVLSLITCQSGTKRSASPDFGHSSFKRHRN